VVATLIFPGNALLAAYAVALTGIGMLTLTGNTVSMDAFGPIADNAQGIAEMAGLPKNARRVVAQLDAVGNTTKAITKGIAIGSAVIAAVSLFGAFIEVTGLTHIDIVNPIVFVGVLIGGAVPFLFSAFLLKAVGRAAFFVVKEVRRQFRVYPGIMKGTQKPQYGRCVDIVTRGALKEMVAPGLLAVGMPVAVGIFFKQLGTGAESVAGFLMVGTITGVLMALFMNNGGGAWDNAKKFIETGQFGGKRSEAHVAAVVGDTVGDPLKDTAGPAINPLIKAINTISVIFAGLVVQLHWLRF
jgi:K(+)-stimulated pyrophosphate-energized sodium pump